ncbi:MAG: peptidylprolyl isomerase [Legionella sp.]|nr:peptidylprolyl isomerase [Legionella sp.]
MLKKMALVYLLFTGIVFAQSRQMLDKVVAVVNDGVITASELNAQVELSRKQIMAQNMQVPEENVLRKQVLQHLIDVDIQLQIAKKNGISVDDLELNKAIEHIAESNKINVTKLREEIVKQGLTWEQYRHNIRKEIIITRLQQKSVGKEVVVTNEQVDDYLKTPTNQDTSSFTYHLQNIVIPLNEEPTPEQLIKAKKIATDLLAKIKKGEDFSRLAIEQSSGEFALEGGDLGERHLAELPEIFSTKVVTMKAGEVVGPLRTGNGFQLIKLIAKSGDNLRHIITQTHVRHILIKQDASMLPSESLNQVNNMYQQLKSGKDFALMAKQYSVDVVSASKGGDLGWVNPGQLVPEFEKAMNDLPLHSISRPIKTQYGWHLIEVMERKEKDDSIAFKKQQVRQFLQQRKFAEAVQNWQQHIRTDAYINIIEKSIA